MSNEPPIDRVTGPLELIGIHLEPDHVSQILGWVPIIVASALTLWGVLAKISSDRKTTVTDTLRQDNENLRAEIAALKQDKRQAEADRDDARAARTKAENDAEDARDDHRHAVGVNRDKDQILLAMSRDLMAAHAAITSGAPPPPPGLHWRVDEYLNNTPAPE